MIEDINRREVREPEIVQVQTRDVADMRYTCDECGLVVTLVSAADEQGRHSVWNDKQSGSDGPRYWRSLSGIVWAEPRQFCSLQCMHDWLRLGKWQPLLDAEIARMKEHRRE